jgi:ligand-binding sensor domain-containing protein
MRLAIFYYALGLLLLVLPQSLSAQEGNLYVKNYPETALLAENNDVLQTPEGLLYFANQRGILTYDGVHWALEEAVGTAYCLALGKSNDKEQRIYVGGKDYFGYLVKNQFGRIEFRSLSQKLEEPGEISKIYVTGDEVLFYTPQAIFLYQDDKPLRKILPPNDKSFAGIMCHEERAIVLVENDTFYEYQKGKLEALGNMGLGEADKLSLQHAFAFDAGKSMVAFSNNFLYLFDGKRFQRFYTTAQQYLNDFVIRQGVSISEQEFLLSTASGGCISIHKRNGLLLKIISFQNGLADDETKAIALDNQEGLWICHKSGVSRVALNLPVSIFSNYPGLQGNVTDVIRMGYQLYVGTNKGIFLLTAGTRSLSSEDRKNAYMQQILPFYFKKIEGIDAKCKELINYKGKLLAATSTGLYEISGGRVGPLLKNTVITAIYPVSQENLMYVATEAGLYLLKERPGYWEKTDTLKVFKDDISSIVRHGNTLWLGGVTKVARIQLKDNGGFGTWESFRFKSSYAENIEVVLLGKEPLFLSSKGAFRYLPALGGVIVPDKEMSKYFTEDFRAIPGTLRSLWIQKSGHWQQLGIDSTRQSSKVQAEQTAYLSLFKNIQDIYEDFEGNLWVATADGVYRINKKAKLLYSPYKQAFVRLVRSDEGEFFSLEDLRLEQDEESHNFFVQVSLPFYLAENDTQYQYRLAGMEDSRWTPWRSKATIEFPYLPSGNYALELRAKNALGEKSETHTFRFKVKPPFWETWWFYLIEICFFIGLLGVAAFYRRTNSNSRWASVLTLLTIITIFEFFVLTLEPYVDSFSGGIPIFKLAMNVALAFYLVPMERRVRTFIEESEYLDRWARKIQEQRAEIGRSDGEIAARGTVISPESEEQKKDWLGRVR